MIKKMKNNSELKPANSLHSKALAFSERIMTRYDSIDKVLNFPNLIYLKNIIPEYYYHPDRSESVTEIRDISYNYIFNIDFDILWNQKNLLEMKNHLHSQELIYRSDDPNKKKGLLNHEFFAGKLKERLPSLGFDVAEEGQHEQRVSEKEPDELKVKDLLYKSGGGGTDAAVAILRNDALDEGTPATVILKGIVHKSDEEINYSAQSPGLVHKKGEAIQETAQEEKRETVLVKKVVESINVKDAVHTAVKTGEVKDSINKIVKRNLEENIDHVYDLLSKKIELEKYKRGIK